MMETITEKAARVGVPMSTEDIALELEIERALVRQAWETLPGLISQRRQAFIAELDDKILAGMLGDLRLRDESFLSPTVFPELFGPEFYQSQRWKALRYRAIVKHGNRCQCCGRGPRDGAVIQVDHIKPRSLRPALMLSLDNLQVLCKDCNHGKSNRDSTDWRPSA